MNRGQGGDKGTGPSSHYSNPGVGQWTRPLVPTLSLSRGYYFSEVFSRVAAI